MFVKALNNHLVFPVQEPTKALKFFPGSRTVIDKTGRHLCAVPHTLEVARILHNKGLTVPSPIRFHYPWPGRYTPLPHQVATAEALTLNMRMFLLSGMGTMKTCSTIWAVDYLMREGLVKRCLVISPLSTLERVWGDELFCTLPRRSAVILHGTREQRLQNLKEKHDFYVINHDGLSLIKDALRDRDDINLIVIDEVAVYRNVNTKRWKIANEVVNLQHPRACWGLTGTPTPRAPTDAYGQMKLIKPENYRGCFTQFKHDTMIQINQFRWVPRRGAEQVVSQVLSPAIRFALEDCVSLPPTIRQNRMCELSVAQAKHYKELMSEAVTEIGDSQVTAVNAAVLLNKLVQVACLAGDTEVLTDRGWTELKDVLPTDKIWDGVEWVRSEGVTCNGFRDVIERSGLTLTPDHLMWTNTGWQPAEEIHKESSWPTVQLPNDYKESRIEQPRKQHSDTNHADVCADRRNAIHQDLSTRPECRKGANNASSGAEKQAVYDLINCGPRNRFVVRGKGGEVRIVHNCGVPYDSNSKAVEIDFGPRLKLLMEIIDECNEKIIVFVPLTGVLETLRAKLSKHWTVEVIDGGTAKGKRNRIFSAFQNDADPKILLANAGAMAHGLNLTAASTIVWYAPINSNDIYTQANARIARPGQTKTTNIIQMMATKAEEKMYKSLAEQTRLQDVVLDLIKGR